MHNIFRFAYFHFTADIIHKNTYSFEKKICLIERKVNINDADKKEITYAKKSIYSCLKHWSTIFMQTKYVANIHHFYLVNQTIFWNLNALTIIIRGSNFNKNDLGNPLSYFVNINFFHEILFCKL